LSQHDFSLERQLSRARPEPGTSGARHGDTSSTGTIPTLNETRNFVLRAQRDS
jgi:hypothetical protein